MDLDAKQDAYNLINDNWDTNRYNKPKLRIEDDTKSGSGQGQGRRMSTSDPTLTIKKTNESIDYTNVRKTHVRIEKTIRIKFYMDSDTKDKLEKELKRILTVNNTRLRGLNTEWNRIDIVEDGIEVEDPLFAIDANGYIDIVFIRSSIPVTDAYEP